MEDAIKFLLPVALVVLPVIVLVQRYLEAKKRFAAAWTSYASTRGFTFQRETLKVQGTVDGRGVEFDTQRLRRGRGLASYTRVSVALADKNDARIDVISDVALEPIGQLAGKPDIQVGDPVFDSKFLVREGADGHAKGLLETPLRRALTAFPVPSLSLRYTGERVELLWFGLEETPGTLDAASRIVLAAAKWRP